jgi:hypothetical protein
MAVFRRVLAVSIGLVLACVASKEGGGSAKSTGGGSTRVEMSAPTGQEAERARKVEVQSSEDLLSLRTEYMKMWDAGFDGTLEVTIAPGDYHPVGWGLEPSMDSWRAQRGEPLIDVVLRGAPSKLLIPGVIRARSVTLEDLILTRRHATHEIEVREGFTMKRCLVIDYRGIPHHGGPQLEVRARGKKGRKLPVAVTIEDSWFVRNWQAETPMIMLGFTIAPDAPGYFDKLTIRRSTFLANLYSSAEVDIDFTGSVVIDDCLFYRTWPDGKMLRFTSTAGARVENSVIVAENIGQVVEIKSSPPIELHGSKIYVKDWTAGTKPPAELAIDPAAILDRGLFEPNEDVVKDAAEMTGDEMPPADLRKRLDAAFRP